MNRTLDDAALEHLLAADDEQIADDGFSAAVMQRLRSQPETRGLEAPAAFAALHRRQRCERRQARWRALGTAGGATLAALAWWAGDGPALALPLAQSLPVVLTLAALAWLVAEQALRDAA
jgi:hypothetical protein